MESRELDIHENNIRMYLLKYAHDNEVNREWMNKILIQILQAYTKKYDD